MSQYVAAFLAVLLCFISLSPVFPQQTTTPQSKLRAIAASHDAVQAAYLNRTYALFRIIDPQYTKKVLEKVPDYSHFRDRVDDWIGGNQDRWHEVEMRLYYCEDLKRAGRLSTEIDASEPDVRWAIFITNGPAVNELVLPCECRGGNGTCNIWTYTWQANGAGQTGLEISCQSQHGESFPTAIIPVDKAGFPSSHPLWPVINYSRFVSALGGTDLWFSIWVPGDQFTRATLDGARLSMVVELLDSSKTRVIIRDSSITSLQVIRGILEASDREDRHLIRAMGYIGFSGIEPGSYAAHLIVTGASNNDGDQWLNIVIPEKSKNSDLLLLEQSAGKGENMLPGIIRGAKNSLYDNPEAFFVPRSKLELYVEVELPFDSDQRYEALVTLLPSPEVPRPAQELVKIGDPFVIADSLDQRFVAGDWETEQTRDFLDSLMASEPSSSAIILLKKTIAPTAGTTIIQVSSSLKENLRSGHYVLTLTVTDLKRQRYFLTARRIIQVSTPNSLLR